MDAPHEPLAGQLLVAVPALGDPNFWRTVVLLVEHTPEGAMGLVLNRPTELTVAEAVEPLAALVEDGACVHYGGPVQPEAVLALAEFDDVALAAAPALGRVGFLGADPDPDELGPHVLRARVFAGYAGWGPGQLEGELGESAWVVAPATPDDVFSEDPGDLWRTVLRRKGGAAAMFALAPEDPTTN
ncbi:MAG: YqgE/AlgH family protein [Thermoleophilia bacterium]